MKFTILFVLFLSVCLPIRSFGEKLNVPHFTTAPESLLPPKIHESAERTRYPVILAHGLLASAHAFSMKRLRRYLRKQGFQVFLTEVDGANTIEYRSRQLSKQVDKILTWTGAEKVNLVGHSMGGLDSRFLISELGYENRVASLTTFSTPHRGSAAADMVLQDLREGGSLIPSLLKWFLSWYNPHSSVFQSDIEVAIENLTPGYMESFNERVEDAPEVFYQSYGANAAESSDALHPIFDEAYQTILQQEGPNDGLVSLDSSRWGAFRGVLPTDHARVVGVRLHPLEPNRFDFRGHMKKVLIDLAGRGF